MTEQRNQSEWTRQFEAVRTSPRWAGPILRAESESELFLERAVNFVNIAKRFLGKHQLATVKMLTSMKEARILPFGMGPIRVTARVASMLRNVDALISAGALTETLKADDMARVRDANIGNFARDLYKGSDAFAAAWCDKYSVEEMVAIATRARLCDVFGKWLISCVSMHAKLHPGTRADSVERMNGKEAQKSIAAVLLGRLRRIANSIGDDAKAFDAFDAFVNKAKRQLESIKNETFSSTPSWVSEWIIPCDPSATLGIGRLESGDLDKMPRLVIETKTETPDIEPSTRVRFANEPDDIETTSFIGIAGMPNNEGPHAKPCPDCGLVHDRDEEEEGSDD